MDDIAERATLTREVRNHDITDLELRADGDGFTFDGIASVVETPYEVRDALGIYSETMAKGAFNRTIAQKADVRLLVNHDGIPLARTKSRTLALSASPDLRAVAKLDPANPTVQEIHSAMDRGDMDQMSIGFRVKDQEWNGDYTERIIREVELFDVSLVTFPASPTTTASIRSLDEYLDSLTDPDEIRDVIDRLTLKIPAKDQPETDANAALRLALWALRQPAA
jgi:HK97 family phage prohead protease